MCGGQNFAITFQQKTPVSSENSRVTSQVASPGQYAKEVSDHFYVTSSIREASIAQILLSYIGEGSICCNADSPFTKAMGQHIVQQYTPDLRQSVKLLPSY